MDFVHIFAWSHPSQLRAFVSFENSSIPITNWQFAIVIPISCKQSTAIITLTSGFLLGFSFKGGAEKNF